VDGRGRNGRSEEGRREMNAQKQRNQKINSTDLEYEVFSLKILVDTIDSMVNHEVLELTGSNPDVTVYFDTSIHQNYFYIILVDFLSKTDQLITGGEFTCVGLLENICSKPQFDMDNSAMPLNQAFNILKAWLEQEVTIVNMWLPSVDKECSIKLARSEFIIISGNISKHHFARLTRIAEKIRKILKKNGVDISFHDALLILPDFYERLNDDILGYHTSYISEMLNNIRWGIHEYLLPEFEQSYQQIDELDYEYVYPEQIKVKFAKNYYWDLMNLIRRKPYVKKFEVTKYLKLRY
jgi:hypothetical protein